MIFYVRRNQAGRFRALREAAEGGERLRNSQPSLACKAATCNRRTRTLELSPRYSSQHVFRWRCDVNMMLHPNHLWAEVSCTTSCDWRMPDNYRACQNLQRGLQDVIASDC
jgi:hypothetical protein